MKFNESEQRSHVVVCVWDPTSTAQYMKKGAIEHVVSRLYQDFQFSNNDW